jgi:hypothetical protein
MNQLLSMRRRSGLQTIVRLSLNMKRLLSVLSALVIAGFGTSRAAAAEDGVALAIIYDTSGSMREQVRDASGKSAPKYVIANRALIAVAKQISTFASAKATGGPFTINTGMYIFEGEHAKEAVKFGPFDAAALENFARQFSDPKGNTPLGNSLNTAARAVLDSPLPRKHVLIITDGINTAGPKPEAVLPRLKKMAADKQTDLSVHFVAFDVDARQFDPVKKLGATVVGASDEKQLDSQLQFILQKKILLEDEEPPKTK